MTKEEFASAVTRFLHCTGGREPSMDQLDAVFRTVSEHPAPRLEVAFELLARKWKAKSFPGSAVIHENLTIARRRESVSQPPQEEPKAEVDPRQGIDRDRAARAAAGTLAPPYDLVLAAIGWKFDADEFEEHAYSFGCRVILDMQSGTFQRHVEIWKNPDRRFIVLVGLCGSIVGRPVGAKEVQAYEKNAEEETNAKPPTRVI